MIVDCDSCQARGPSCSDCVVTFLLGPPAFYSLLRGQTRERLLETVAENDDLRAVRHAEQNAPSGFRQRLRAQELLARV